MRVETSADLDGLLAIGAVVARTIAAMRDAVQPGITTLELDRIGAQTLKQYGARSAPMLTYKFPAVTCISLNDEVAHGIASPRIVQAGDLVNIDVSAELDGFYADAGMSLAVPPVAAETERLLNAGKRALHQAIDAARAGSRLNAIGRAVEAVASESGYRIIRDLGGHGVGRGLHEEPRRIPNYFTNRAKDKLEAGMVLTVEPFLTPGKGVIFTAADGWTLQTTDRTVAVQFEHTVVITEAAPILTTFVEGVTGY